MGRKTGHPAGLARAFQGRMGAHMSTSKPATTAKELLARLSAWEALDDRALVTAARDIRAEQTIEQVTTSYGAQEFRLELVALDSSRVTSKQASTTALEESREIWERYRQLSGRLRVAEEAAKIRSEVGKLGGRGKVAMNPLAGLKAEAKKGALLLWEERQLGLHPRLRTVTHFATEVMHRWPVLTSQKVIERWSALWSRAVSEGRPPTC